MNALALNDDERADLVRHEQIIAQHRDGFIKVGMALGDIRQRRLYRDDYPTFEEYCQQRWGFGRRHGDRMISAAQVGQLLGPIGPVANEAQARELAGLRSDEQQLIWEIVQHTAPNGAVTAAHIRSVVAIIKDVSTTGAIDAGDGQDIPIAAATPDHLKAAVVEDVYERMRRQQEYIADRTARTAAPRLTFDGLLANDLPARVREELARHGYAESRVKVIVIVEVNHA